MRTTGIVIAVPGIILAAIGFIWGWVVGFYPSELPYVIGLVAGGGLLAWIGFKVMERGEKDEDAGPQRAVSAGTAGGAPAPAASPVAVAPNPYLAAVAPAAAAAAATGPASAGDLPSGASAAELAELAATRPELWSRIETHPNVYPGLIAWIAEARGSGSAAARVADPATTAKELAELAQRHPELRPAIAAHPAAYPALKEWIAKAAR